MSQFHPADRPEFPRLPSTNAKPSDQQAALRKHLPRYKVVLLRNGVDDLMYVVRCVMELMRYPRAEATHKMWEAHHCGRSVLLTTYRERAELFVEQFAEKGLSVALEPVAAA
jgi:ATP-dependent Clp protease adapter protein ClpS